MHLPRNLLLQWHITNRCNQRCTHCYQEEYSGEEPDWTMLLHVLQQFSALMRQLAQHQGRPARGHVTVTGGEPFLHDSFLRLLEVLAQQPQGFSFAILTNGSLIDSSLARRLQGLHPAFVQVSLEGAPATHDRIRGEGSYARTLKAMELLVRHGVRTYVSFTAHQGNFHEFPHVAQEARRIGVARVWADRLLPHGRPHPDQPLTAQQHRAFLEIMDAERRRRAWFCRRHRTEITMGRALQFLIAGGRPYRCPAGDTLITVMPNGDVYPCRRLPIAAGSLHERPLADIYQHSRLFQQLRERTRIPAGCGACLHRHLCQGGLKCLASAVAGDPFAGDPGCWLREEKHR